MEKLYDDIVLIEIDDMMCLEINEKCEKFFLDFFDFFLIVWKFLWIL